jgi:excisionase family DNA binding protein
VDQEALMVCPWPRRRGRFPAPYLPGADLDVPEAELRGRPGQGVGEGLLRSVPGMLAGSLQAHIADGTCHERHDPDHLGYAGRRVLVSRKWSGKTLAEAGIPVLLVGPEDAARALGIGRTKVYELMRSGALRSVRLDGSRRIPVTALTEFVKQLEREAAA